MGEGDSRKTNREGKLPKKEGFGQFADSRGKGVLDKKEGVVFLRGGGVDTPMNTFSIALSS